MLASKVTISYTSQNSGNPSKSALGVVKKKVSIFVVVEIFFVCLLITSIFRIKMLEYIHVSRY